MDVERTRKDTGEADAVLVQRMAEGDRDAFSVLFERHRGAVYRFARQMSGSADIAEDVTQDVFLTFMRNGRRYEPSWCRLSTYLYGVARNHVRRRLRWQRWRVTLDPRSLDDKVPSNLIVHHDATEELERLEKIRAVRRAIVSLPVRYREVLVLCELNGLTYEQAATVTKAEIGTVRSRLSRARVLLGRKLHRWRTERIEEPPGAKEVLHESSAS